MNVISFRKISLLILYLLAGTVLFAQSGQVLTLYSAIAMSLKNSSRLKGSQARIEAAVAATKEAADAKLPDVKVSGAYLRVSNPVLSLKSSKGSSGGGTDTTGTISAVHVSQAAYGIVNASLPIYAGSRIKYGIESSKYLE